MPRATGRFTSIPNGLTKMVNRFFARDYRFAKFMNWFTVFDNQFTPPPNGFIKSNHRFFPTVNRFTPEHNQFTLLV